MHRGALGADPGNAQAGAPFVPILSETPHREIAVRPFDSSKTRVAPVFEQLRAQSHDGSAWIHRLLALSCHGATRLTNPAPQRISSPQFGTTFGWSDREVALAPPRSLLMWLVRHLEMPARESDLGNGPTLEKRKALANRDPKVVAEALALLDSRSASERHPRAWYVLEGASSPDVFLETDQAIIVIEGKRTEPGPTTSTSFLPGRHQMLRHMDCAWEIRRGRPVYGFFIVEEHADDHDWIDFAAATCSDAAIEGSLPHRGVNERLAIRRGFLGFTTWRAVCAEFAIDMATLPDQVSA